MNLKTKIVTTVTTIIITIAATGFISSYLQLDSTTERYQDLSVNGEEKLWHMIVKNQTEAMKTHTKSITRDRKIKKNISSNQSHELIELTNSSYFSLEAEGIISNLQLMNKDGKILYNANDTSGIGGINAFSVAAIEQKNQLTTFSKDAKNNLQIELVFPITKRGKVIGAGSYSLALEKTISILRQNLVANAYIKEASGSVLSYTDKDNDVSDKIKEQVKFMDNNQNFVLEKDGKTYSTTVLVLKDINNKTISNLVVVIDETDSYNQQKAIKFTAILMLIIMSLLAMLYLYWYLNKNLAPLNSISKSLTAVSQGDLTVSIQCNKNNDEISEIQTAISNTINNLHNLVSDITPLVGDVNSSSEKLTSSIQGSQKNIGNQQDNIEQVSHAVNNVQAAISTISDYSKGMSDHSQQTNAELVNGSLVIEKTLNSVKRIANQINSSESLINDLSNETQSIDSILDVIKGVAEQTNLLALNAAIEAARAGEHGRGFAVVADEVRSLAGKTQEATQQIEQMIGSIRSSVGSVVVDMKKSSGEAQTCVKHANETEKTLAVITPKVAEIETNNVKINNLIIEQEKAIQKINQNLLIIRKLANDSAEENNKSVQISSSLKSLATNLERMIVTFKV